MTGTSTAVRRLGAATAIVGLILLVLIGATWLNRRAAAREVLVGWLDRRGIEAEVEIERLDLDGLVARVRIGDPANPDVTIQRVEVDYAIASPWSQAGIGVAPSRIRLVRPVARARWRDGRVSFGALDPVIREFAGRPPRPDSRGPVVVVETGHLRLDTDYGPVSVLADARIDDGRLTRLRARMPAADLGSGDSGARGLGGRLDLTTRGDRVAATWSLSAGRISRAGVSGEDVRSSGAADLPYPDFQSRRSDGRATLDLVVTAGRLTVGEVRAASARLALAVAGDATGWIETLGFNGAGTARLTLDRLGAPGLSARGVDVAMTRARLSLSHRGSGPDWAAEGPASLRFVSGQAGDLSLSRATLTSERLSLGVTAGRSAATGAVGARIDAATLGDLALRDVSGDLALDYAVERSGALLLTGSASAARGAWPLFGAVTGDDVPELAGMKRALSAFSVAAPAFHLTTGEMGTVVSLAAPVRVAPANGGALIVSPAAAPIFAARPGERGAGALTLTATRGRGLPEAAFAVPDWRLTPGGFQARLDGRAALDFGLARGLTLRTRGLLATERGRLTYVASGCAPFTAERLDLDENDVMDLSGRLCPSGGPTVVSESGRWRAGGRIEGVAAAVPFLALAVAEVSGAVTATGSSDGLSLDARVDSAGVEDATRPRRFHRLDAHGAATLTDERWSGAFDLTRGDVALGRLTLAHDGRTGDGGVTIDAPSIAFAEGALQPADLSPVAADVVQSPVTGSASFTGRVDWSPTLPEGGSSSGRLVIPSLDFISPAGPVKGLSGTIDFVNLAPLTTAPDQTLRVATLQSVADLTDLDLTFSLDKAAFAVSGGEIQAAGGVVRVEPFSVPLSRRPFSGVIVLDRVQLGELISGAGFGDRVSLDAVVSGRLPFVSDPDRGITITGGTLYAARPGRLSIAREALSGLEAGGGGGVPPGTVQDLAYQAMENLAFDVLTAEVNSLDEGRVSVLFRIVGRHDPPRHQELRLSLSELVSREFLNRPLPLPSDTGIDLTLDTTLNLNQLVSDLLAVNRARNGTPAPERP